MCVCVCVYIYIWEGSYAGVFELKYKQERNSCRELEKRLSIACTVYFEDEGGGLAFLWSDALLG
jgi:hypothetical protein